MICVPDFKTELFQQLENWNLKPGALVTHKVLIYNCVGKIIT